MERNEKMFLRAEEVAELMEVSVPYAYKLIRRMNREPSIISTEPERRRADAGL